MKQKIKIVGVQANLVWHDAQANCAHFSKLITNAPKADAYILPEMFNTGFTMESEQLAEPVNGPTHQWMQQMASEANAVVAGSVITREKNHIFNRFYWVSPDGKTEYYDKRHRFTMAGEHEHFSAGNRQLIVELHGWKIMLQVCYDLRFPVWSRNTSNYHGLINVACWPEVRVSAWSSLLVARAIENQCYVVGVNRVGTDGNGVIYSGNSAIIDPKGSVLASGEAHAESVIVAEWDMGELQQFREKFPVLEDRDPFTLVEVPADLPKE